MQFEDDVDEAEQGARTACGVAFVRGLLRGWCNSKTATPPPRDAWSGCNIVINVPASLSLRPGRNEASGSTTNKSSSPD